MKNFTIVFLSFAILTIACHPAKRLSLQPLPSFDKEGHRGCRGLMPENSIPAMLKAVDVGVTTLEMDAVITKDGKVILSHEPFFNHEITTKKDGTWVTEQEERSLNIFQMTYEETMSFDVGMREHPRFPTKVKLPVHKPLLSDVIDSVKAYCHRKGVPVPFFNIETKSQPATDNVYHPAPAAFVDMVMAVVRSKGITDRVIIQSFDFRTLKEVHQRYPGTRTSALIEDYDKASFSEQVSKLGFVPDIYSPHYSLVNEALVDACHAKKVKLVPWTINDAETIVRLRRLGVDGIISDYPDLLNNTE